MEVVDIVLSAAGAIAVDVLVSETYTLLAISIGAGLLTFGVLMVVKRYRSEEEAKKLVALLPTGLDWTVKLIGGAMVGSAIKLASEFLWPGILLLVLDCFLLLLTIDLVRPSQTEPTSLS